MKIISKWVWIVRCLGDRPTIRIAASDVKEATQLFENGFPDAIIRELIRDDDVGTIIVAVL